MGENDGVFGQHHAPEQAKEPTRVDSELLQTTIPPDVRRRVLYLPVCVDRQTRPHVGLLLHAPLAARVVLSPTLRHFWLRIRVRRRVCPAHRFSVVA